MSFGWMDVSYPSRIDQQRARGSFVSHLRCRRGMKHQEPWLEWDRLVVRREAPPAAAVLRVPVRH